MKKTRNVSDAERLRRAERMKRLRADPEFMRLRADPDFKAKHATASSERLKELHKDPDFKAKVAAAARETLKRRNADPEFRAAASERMKRLHAAAAKWEALNEVHEQSARANADDRVTPKAANRARKAKPDA